jgi:predicted GTPase
MRILNCLSNLVAKRWCGNLSLAQHVPKSTERYLTVTLIGQPNVGKSTIFNRFCKHEGSIVSPFSGTTRDRKESLATISGLDFKLIDTAGFDDRGEYSPQIVDQVKRAVLQSDVILFVVDGKNGINSIDFDCSNWIRVLPNVQPHPREVILVGYHTTRLHVTLLISC